MEMSIRPATTADAAEMLAIYAEFIIHTPVSFETEVPSLAQFQQRIAEYSRHAPWLVCEMEGRIAGYAYGSRHRQRDAYQWSVDATVYVHGDFRRKGIAVALYGSLFRCLGAQGFCTVYAAITLPNPASVRLHESLGFKSIGVYEGVGYKLGRWHDVGWWALRLRDLPENPQPPRAPETALADMRLGPLEPGDIQGKPGIMRGKPGGTAK